MSVTRRGREHGAPARPMRMQKLSHEAMSLTTLSGTRRRAAAAAASSCRSSPSSHVAYGRRDGLSLCAPSAQMQFAAIDRTTLSTSLAKKPSTEDVHNPIV